MCRRRCVVVVLSVWFLQWCQFHLCPPSLMLRHIGQLCFGRWMCCCKISNKAGGGHGCRSRNSQWCSFVWSVKEGVASKEQVFTTGVLDLGPNCCGLYLAKLLISTLGNKMVSLPAVRETLPSPLWVQTVAEEKRKWQNPVNEGLAWGKANYCFAVHLWNEYPLNCELEVRVN